MPVSAVCFVHIPKTAGTSFRVAALRYFRQERCFFDYGVNTPETSSLVKDFAYTLKDFFLLEKALTDAPCLFFGGHFKACQYMSIFPAIKLTCFVRQPLAQLCSHYAHFVRHHGYTESFEKFIANPHKGPGLQSRILSGIPLEAIGFVGVAERYDDSLRVFNAYHGTVLEPARLNQNPAKEFSETYDFPQDLLDKYREKIDQDQTLYKRANALLDARIQALDADQPFTHGAITDITGVQLSGFAFFPHEASPVTVEVVVNDKPVFTEDAINDRPALRAVNVPRNGFVGFDFRPPRPFSPGDLIVVRVVETGQKLGEVLVPIG